MEDFNDNMNYNFNHNQPNGEPYSNPNNQFYNISEGQKPVWAAIVSFVLSIINLVTCCCSGYVAMIISLILGIISLVKKWGGKGFAIAGVAISSVCLVITIFSQIFLGGLSTCLTDVMSTAPQYYEEYSKTGEIPEEMEKYNNDEYDWYWKMTGNDSFAEFYDQWMTIYGGIAAASEYSEDSESSDNAINDDDFFNYGDEDFFGYDDYYGGDESSEPEFGETPVEL